MHVRVECLLFHLLTFVGSLVMTGLIKEFSRQDWFDGRVADSILTREKLFFKFKKSIHYIDEEIFKTVKNQVQNLIKKRNEISIKLTLSEK